jgi:hypothetical protein
MCLSEDVKKKVETREEVDAIYRKMTFLFRIVRYWTVSVVSRRSVELSIKTTAIEAEMSRLHPIEAVENTCQ